MPVFSNLTPNTDFPLGASMLDVIFCSTAPSQL
jgi:hypothetical protein